MTEDRMLRIDDVMDMVGMRMSKVYRLVRQGKFPRQVKVGRQSLWRLSDVQNWIASQGAG